MQPISVHEARQAAEDAFANGLYCAESVVRALANAQGVESDLLPKIATAFCAGMSRMCGPCGALTGAVMGVSLALGRSKPGESVKESYIATQKLIGEFEEKFGARNCDALLGCDLGTPEGQAAFRENRLHERCKEYTATASEIAARLIGECGSENQRGA
ncbi:C_GCAxxG_C_C family protein [Herbaspirillum sp. HC18]|nr:C_GCAxxG_C_C family protein [Herbaspirillum sp. HC18]